MDPVASPLANSSSSVASLSGDPILTEGRDRLKRILEVEAVARQRFISDVKFRHGDSDNKFQWPNEIYRTRDASRKPCLTINNVRQHNLQIVNDLKQNKSAIAIRPTGGGASKESANCISDLVRHIEYKSNASKAYYSALEFAVDGGIGWWRLVTEYENSHSHNLDIAIRPIPDPLSVFIDPDCKEFDKSDSKFGFVLTTLPRSEFIAAYPKFADKASSDPLGFSAMTDSWLMLQTDDVALMEYFRKVPKEDKLYEFLDRPSGERRTIRASKMPKNLMRKLVDDPETREREVLDQVVEWRLIVGETIMDTTEWPGKYIPLVPVIGEETYIGGIMDRKGHTRALKDAQRMYNYNASSQVEFVALQTKTPWTGSAKSIEGFEPMWNNANTTNASFLPFNHADDEGQELPVQALPRRLEPPNMAPGFQAGMEIAFTQMMMASGQWQNQMGMMGNERTGKAIQERQHQSDTAVFHFQDNFNVALRATGIQILDLIPKVYDTKRIIMARAENGADYEMTIDPTQRTAFLQEQAKDSAIARRVMNPAVGAYDVEAGNGPAYGTKRDQTVEAMTLLLTQNPGLTGIVGDLLLSAMDFEEADEAAARLRRMVPPQALGQGPSQEEQQMKAQIINLQAALSKSLQANAKEQLRLAGKDQMRDIDAYKAETDRFAALKDSLPMDKEGLQQVLQQLVSETLKTQLSPIVAANSGEAGIGGQSGDSVPAVPAAPAPMPGAKQAPDGNWYILDPSRRGKYLRIAPLAQLRQPPKMANLGA